MTKIAVIAILLLLVVILGPFAVIWSLNTLFGLAIAYTFWTWLAVIVLGSYLNANIGRKSS